ncbi:ferredoxin [Paramicrobacterium agarici]|uniref:Ferredoxin n=1 Tax=Paramicrobacterium agarici TaxID=630514 RepID=A0A2A9DTQ7_9MICO|nr:ferredoxin [Microbacterium agarici]PFG29974.1 NAD-dependent dihydropyrimidine dehydrogenase PreA subunit [Microbacterium agarici]
MVYVIGSACVDVKDLGCIDACPVDCIYQGDRTLYIQPDECVDCGACEPVCPVEAITYVDDVEPEDEKFVGIAYELFDKVGSPGGAAAHGPVEDHPAVTALPPREASTT